MPIINPNLLRSIPLFELMDNDELDALCAQLDQKHFWAGQLVFSENDPGGMMYIVQSGTVELFIKDKSGARVVLDVVRPGEMFGELSLLDNDLRSASAKAVEDTLLFVVDRHDLEMLFKIHPDSAFDVLKTLARRIREADVLVSERVVARNVNEALGRRRTFSQRLADLLAYVAGDMRFVYFSAAWFTVWIVINLGLIPGVEPFDPFPFGLLTMIVSLEAIFLSTFVLVSQNRQTERDKVRNDIEYEVNVKAELGVQELHNKIDALQDMLLSHLKRIDDNVEHSVKLQTGNSANVRARNSGSPDVS